MADIGKVVILLEASLNQENTTRRAAEKELEQYAKLPIWPSGLLQIVGDPRFSSNVHLSAALALKRCTKEHWHYDDPQVGSSPYVAEVKEMVRSNFFRTATLHSSFVPVLNALSDSFYNIAQHDYPGLWPSINDEIHSGLSSADPPRTIVTLRLMYSLARNYQFKSFNEFRDGPSPMSLLLNINMSVFFSLTSYLVSTCLTNPASASGLHQCLKVYYRCMKHRFTEYAAICQKESSHAWCSLCIDVLRQALPPPGPGSPCPEVDRAQWHPWRAKKWAARILERMAEKWGQPRNLEEELGGEEGEEDGGGSLPPSVRGTKEYEEWEKNQGEERAKRAIISRALPASRAFKATLAPIVVETVLGQLLQWAAGCGGTGREGAEWLPPKIRVLYMCIVDASSDFKSVWVPLRPHMPLLIQSFLPAALRPTAEDLQDFDADPESWMLDQSNDFFSSDPRSCAERLLKSLLEKRKKTSLPLLLDTVQQGVSAYASAPPQSRDYLGKEAILRMLSASNDVIRRQKALRGNLDMLMSSHVTPDMLSPVPPFLRVRALDTWAAYVDCNSISKATKLAACLNLLGCLHDSSLPVRHSAARVLSYFLKSKACRAQVRPYITGVISKIFSLLAELGLSSVVETVQLIVEHYHEDLLSIAGPVAHNLTAYCLKCVLCLENEEEDKNVVEEASMSANACSTVLMIMIEKLQMPPDWQKPSGPGGATGSELNWAAGISVLKEQVLPPIWGLLEAVLDEKRGSMSRNDFLEEALEIYCVVLETLELELPLASPAWTTFALLQRYVGQHATEWAQCWASATDMLICGGGPYGRFHGRDPATGIDYGEELMACLEFFKDAAEDEKEIAAKIAQSLLHNCRGSVDRLLQRLVSLFALELIEARTEEYKRACSLVFCMAFQYNATLTVSALFSLPPGLLPQGQTSADVVSVLLGVIRESTAPPKPTRNRESQTILDVFLGDRSPKHPDFQIMSLGLCCLLKAVAGGAIPFSLFPLPTVLELTATAVTKEASSLAELAHKQANKSALAAANGLEEEEEEEEEEEKEGEDDVDGGTDVEDEELGNEDGSFKGSEMDSFEDEGSELGEDMGPLSHVCTVIWFSSTLSVLANSPLWPTLTSSIGEGLNKQIQLCVVLSQQKVAAGTPAGALGPQPAPAHPCAHMWSITP